MAGQAFKEKALALWVRVINFGGSAQKKINRLLADFNRSIPVIQGLGLAVQDFQVGMGLIPEIKAKLVGDIKKIDPGTLQSLASTHEGNKFLSGILTGLQRAYELKEMMGDVIFTGVEVDLKLGLPPKVSVGFMK